MPSSYDLASDWSKAWTLHRDPGLGGGATQVPGGLILAAAPLVQDKAVYDRSSATLWSHASWVGDFRVEFDFTRLDGVAATGGNGIGAMMYFHAEGGGAGKPPRSFAEWSPDHGGEGAYVAQGRGYRVTWSNFNSLHPQNSHQIRLRTFAFTRRYPTQVGVDSPARFRFERGQTHRMAFAKRGRTFSVEVDDDGFQWADAVLTRFAAGHFGLRHQPGRVARYENLRIERP